MLGYLFLLDTDGTPIDFGWPYGPAPGDFSGHIWLLDTDGTPIDLGWPYGPVDGEFVSDLLPSNAMAFERAVGEAMTDALPVPLSRIMDPAVTPAEWLPWLAAHYSVDFWYEDWPLARKRQMVANAIRLARLKGTRDAVVEFLAFVDGLLIDTVAYPERFIFGRAIIGRTPVNHPPYVARYLVKTTTFRQPRAFVFGRAVIGRSILKTPDREKLKRCMTAITVAKAPETEVRVDFAHKRQANFGDGFTFGGGLTFGRYLDRTVLS